MTGGENLRGDGENKAEQIRQLLPSMIEEIRIAMTEDTGLSDKMREMISAALTIKLEEVVSEILDRSMVYKGWKAREQISLILTRNIMKNDGGRLSPQEKSILTDFVIKALPEMNTQH